MMSTGSYWYGFWEANPRRWEQCRRKVYADMIASGWDPSAKKLDEVLKRRARRLFFAG